MRVYPLLLSLFVTLLTSLTAPAWGMDILLARVIAIDTSQTRVEVELAGGDSPEHLFLELSQQPGLVDELTDGMLVRLWGEKGDGTFVVNRITPASSARSSSRLLSVRSRMSGNRASNGGGGGAGGNGGAGNGGGQGNGGGGGH